MLLHSLSIYDDKFLFKEKYEEKRGSVNNFV